MRRWFQLLLGGLVLLYLIERKALTTESLNYVPSIILLEPFLLPVVFIPGLYEPFSMWRVLLAPLAVCVGRGGPWVAVFAGVLKYSLLKILG